MEGGGGDGHRILFSPDGGGGGRGVDTEHFSHLMGGGGWTQNTFLTWLGGGGGC